MSTVRLRRLSADFVQLEDYTKRHPRLRLIQAEGDPPEKYQIEYRIRSLRQIGSELSEVKSHIVEIALPRNYPRVPPQCRMLSPVFHPNIAPHAICVGDHWSAGESLKSIVMRIGEMLAYQSYNVKSPLNGEAARWVDEHEAELPLDRVSMLVVESESPTSNDQTNVADQPLQERTVAQPEHDSVLAKTNPTPQSIERTPAKRSAPEDRFEEFFSAVNEPQPVNETFTEVTEVQEVAASPQPVLTTPDENQIVNVLCPYCDTSYRIPTKHLGRSAECRVCKKRFQIRVD